MEKQFKTYYKEAARKKGVTGDNLLQMLESRLIMWFTEWDLHQLGQRG